MPAHLALLGDLSANHLLSSLGVAGVLLILFAETGLLIGFFLPGDTLLFAAGAATVVPNQLHQKFPLGWLLAAGVVGATLGAQLGYELGRRAGAPLFERSESRFFRPEHVQRARRVLNRFGPGRAVVLARFVPVVRTVMNPMAGVVGVRPRTFTLANLVGGVLWPVLLILLGHGFGHVAFIRDHIEELVLLGFLSAAVPVLVEGLRRGSRSRSRSRSGSR